MTWLALHAEVTREFATEPLFDRLVNALWVRRVRMLDRRRADYASDRAARARTERTYYQANRASIIARRKARYNQITAEIRACRG